MTLPGTSERGRIVNEETVAQTIKDTEKTINQWKAPPFRLIILFRVFGVK